MKTIFETYWGIDVSKKWLDISTGIHVIRIDQTQEALEKFLNDIDVKAEETLITLERNQTKERRNI